jgi:hypothetical protein
VLHAVCDDAQGEGLGSGNCLLAALPVRKDARQLGHLGDPATIFLAFNLDGKTHPAPSAN